MVLGGFAAMAPSSAQLPDTSPRPMSVPPLQRSSWKASHLLPLTAIYSLILLSFVQFQFLKFC